MTITAVRNGNWSDTGMWSNSIVPTTGDDVDLAGFSVTFNVSSTSPATITLNGGSLEFPPSSGDFILSTVTIGPYVGTYQPLFNSDVRAGIPFGSGDTGVLNLPTIADVRQGTVYDFGTKEGTLNLPAEINVRAEVQYDNNNMIGTLDLPSDVDVRQGIQYDTTTKTGLLTLPILADVRLSTQYDNGTKSGTLNLPDGADVRFGVEYDNISQSGTLNLPVESDVRFGVEYDAATKTGTLNLPVESNVREGILYDNNFKTGTLESGSSAPKVRTIAGTLVSVSTYFSRHIDIPRTLLSLISRGTSSVTVTGSISMDAPAIELFNDTITNSVAVKIDIAGIVILNIRVNSGNPILGNLS